MLTLMLEAQTKLNNGEGFFGVPTQKFWDNLRLSDDCKDVKASNLCGVVTGSRSKEFLYPLHSVLCLKHSPSPIDIIKMLIKLFPEALYKRTKTGLTPLHLAVRNFNDIEIIQLVLEAYPTAARN